MSILTKKGSYLKFKKGTDGIYSGEVSSAQAPAIFEEVLAECGVRLRTPDHKLLGFSFFVYDKGLFAGSNDKPLGLGVIYLKPNSVKTQDIFFFHPTDEIEKFYGEEKMVKKYPWMKGVHKEKIPL